MASGVVRKEVDKPGTADSSRAANPVTRWAIFNIFDELTDRMMTHGAAERAHVANGQLNGRGAPVIKVGGAAGW